MDSEEKGNVLFKGTVSQDFLVSVFASFYSSLVPLEMHSDDFDFCGIKCLLNGVRYTTEWRHGGVRYTAEMHK